MLKRLARRDAKSFVSASEYFLIRSLGDAMVPMSSSLWLRGFMSVGGRNKQVVCRGPGCTCVVCSTSRAMGRFGSVRMTHCDCPGVESATKSADITIVYDPDQLDRFLECADAIEAAYPSLIVEGGEYLRMQGVSPAQDRELAGTALDLQVSRAEVSNAKRRPILARGGFCAVEGEQGQFDIAGDSGEVVYRPLTAGHFPTPEDVTAIVSARIKVEESA